MNEMRRVLALLLCFVMLVGMLPAGALATDAQTTEPSETVVETTAVTEATSAAQETTLPAETESIPTESVEESVPATTVVTEPVETEEETTAPSETEETVPEVTGETEVAEEEAAAEETPEFMSLTRSTDSVDYLMLGSDRHGETTVVPALLTKMEAAIDGDNMIDYVGLLGDMVNSTNSYDTADLLEEVKQVESHLTYNEVDIIYAAHDKGTVTDTNGMLNKTSGCWYTDDDFYIYGVIQDDVSSTTNASSAASTFTNWANDLAATDTRVIVVISHFPLHDKRGDNNGAYYWHQALNTAATGAASGVSEVKRNVLFFHGHNHTEDSKEYFYEVGDEMTIENNGTSTTESIYYTYATAGYMLTDSNDGAKGGNGHATLLAIGDSDISLSRYDYSTGLITDSDEYAYLTDTDTDGTVSISRVIRKCIITTRLASHPWL